jgi:chloramphenicol 3-O phosphotransferase
MKTQVIVLNGSSSSGKTTIARCLKAILPIPWISLSIDDLLGSLPPSLMDSDAGITFGEVTIGEGFREIRSAWLAGIAAMARAGTRIIYDSDTTGRRTPTTSLSPERCRSRTSCSHSDKRTDPVSW